MLKTIINKEQIIPLQEIYGGTGKSYFNEILQIENGGTGLTNIPQNHIIIGNNDKISTYKINGSILDSNSCQSFINKIINGETNIISKINLESDITGILPVINGGTGYSSIESDTILIGNNTNIPTKVQLNKNIHFSKFNNGVQEIGTEASIIDNSIYLTPISGYYIFKWSISCDYERDNSIDNYLKIICITPYKKYENIAIIPENKKSTITINSTIIILLNTGDNVYLQSSLKSPIKSAKISNESWLSIQLLSIANII